MDYMEVTFHVRPAEEEVAEMRGRLFSRLKEWISIRTFTKNLQDIKIISYDVQFNSNPPIQHCSLCKTFDFMNGSYITFAIEIRNQ